MTDNIKTLKTGYTTGSCATAATTAALELLFNCETKDNVQITLPTGDTATIEIVDSTLHSDYATARVKKYSGDDPDITNGATITSSIKLNDSNEIKFFAGEGVGVVTKEGLQIPVGEPAINPVPREMMTKAVREYTKSGVDITIGVEGGAALAEKTFNPRLGIKDGISIIGTSGIVRPFSHEAIEETVKVNIDVATANSESELVIVAGHYGMKAATTFFTLKTDQIIEVSNSWGTALVHAKEKGVDSLLLLSHPGKLAKLIDNYFNTHSSDSPSALPIVKRIAESIGITIDTESTTVDGVFKELSVDTSKILADKLADLISNAAQKRSDIANVAVVLIDMQKNELGHSKGTSRWQRK